MPKINFQNFLKKKGDVIIEKIRQKKDKILIDSNILDFFKIKEYRLKKRIINIIIKELFTYDKCKALECLVLVNIGYINSIEQTKASIDFLNFIADQITRDNYNHQSAIISLHLFLIHHTRYESTINGYNNHEFHLVLRELDEDKQSSLLKPIIEGIMKNEKILVNINNFLDKILKQVPSKYNSSEKLSFELLFDKVFKNKPELLSQFKEPLYKFLRNNINEVFQKTNVFIVFKHVYVDLYNDKEDIFKLFDQILDKNLIGKKYVAKFVSLISNFMPHHWNHPFFRKHYKKLFQLLYELKQDWDIENLGIILYHFDFGSLKGIDPKYPIDYKFLEKTFEDLEIIYRSNESNIFNVAYQKFESFIKRKVVSNKIIEYKEKEIIEGNANLERWGRLLKKSPEEIQRWLDNFQPEEQYYLSKLLDKIRYIDTKELEKICKELYTKILEELPKSCEDFIFVSLGGEAKSDKLIAYHFRINNGIPEEKFIHPLDPQLKEIRKTNIIYLDDVAGTGNQLSEDWKNFKENFNSDFLDNNNFIFAPIFITEKAKDKIEKETEFKIINIENHLLTNQDCVIDIASGIFTEDELDKVIGIFKKYGDILYPKGPLGYGETALLIAFSYNTPNNTLPIIWQESPSTTFPWYPLYPRKKPKRGKPSILKTKKLVKERVKKDSKQNSKIEIAKVYRKDNENEIIFIFRIKIKNISKKTIENLIISEEIYDKNDNLLFENSECFKFNSDDISITLNPGQETLINILSLRTKRNFLILPGSHADDPIFGSILDYMNTIKLRYESISGHQLENKGYLEVFKRNIKIRIEITAKDLPPEEKYLMFQVYNDHRDQLGWVFKEFDEKKFQENLELQLIFGILDYWNTPFSDKESKKNYLKKILTFDFKKILEFFKDSEKNDIEKILKEIQQRE